MPQKNISIPKKELLEALSQGLSTFYNLLELYLGDLNKAGDVRLSVTIAKKELAGYLRKHPEQMTEHIFKKGSSRHHEQPILDFENGKYRVYEMDHDSEWDIREYEDMAEATADYLLYNLEPPTGQQE